MSKLAWTPWHKALRLRDDVRSGELSLAIFAADLYDVIMGKARPVHQDPVEFFSLTYPTFNLRELAKDVIGRLAGKNDKAVRQLELTYGGGKTYSLVTLYHLVREPDALPDLPAVAQFKEHIGHTIPKTRVAALAFDKLDVEKGMEVRSPDGKLRWLKHPWSVLAFQIAGKDGLKVLHPEGRDEERDSAPAENLLADLLAIPTNEGLSTLILIDEVLMFAREKVGLDESWRGRLVNFFQYLTQAVVKNDHCAMVASLLATDPHKSDQLGKALTAELYAIFRRQREEGVQPVGKDDVAEILRRRFFTTDSIRDSDAFRTHVLAALKGIVVLDEQTKKAGKLAEDEYLRSYPFHPGLTDVFFAKWTNLEGFQRTRGILRTFALALRDAGKWDESPLIGTNVFLSPPGKSAISEAARELTTVAETEEYEGKRQDWSGILQGELEKAEAVQQDFPSLRHREIEQAVFATFLHSQPIGQKVLTPELLVLLGHTRPDKIELEKALIGWARLSWFLDDAAINEALRSDGTQELPKSWRLGSKPNLIQMHHDARLRVSPDLVEAKLLDEIQKLKSLTAGASAAGARVHNLPAKPAEIQDDGELHYGVLGPNAASDSGKPSSEARRFIEETTGPDRPRVYRNAVVLAVPSRDGLEVSRNALRDYLAWEEVRGQLKGQELDPIREATLAAQLATAKKRLPEALQQAYCIVVTVSDKNDIHAFKVAIGSDPLFTTTKNDKRSRIQDTPVSADALLPGGPYDLWREGEEARRVKDLVGAFAQFPHLPKMLNRSAIVDTLVDGCRQGVLVLRLTRPDRSLRTWWRDTPDESALKDPGLEAVLPEAATLTELPSTILRPGVLPSLWSGAALRFGDLCNYFAGGRTAKVQKEGYEETVAIPKGDRDVVEAAVGSAVRESVLWLTSGPASVFGEEIPTGILTDDAVLQVPPQPVSAMDILPESLSDAWSTDSTTGLAISVALSKRTGKTLPWATIREAIDGALRARLLERTIDSSPWPCDYPAAATVNLRAPSEAPTPLPKPIPRPAGMRVAEAELRPNEIQDLADQIGEIVKAAVGMELKFHVRIEVGGNEKLSEAMIEQINKLLGQISEDFKLK